MPWPPLRTMLDGPTFFFLGGEELSCWHRNFRKNMRCPARRRRRWHSWESVARGIPRRYHRRLPNPRRRAARPPRPAFARPPAPVRRSGRDRRGTPPPSSPGRSRGRSSGRCGSARPGCGGRAGRPRRGGIGDSPRAAAPWRGGGRHRGRPRERLGRGREVRGRRDRRRRRRRRSGWSASGATCGWGRRRWTTTTSSWRPLLPVWSLVLELCALGTCKQDGGCVLDFVGTYYWRYRTSRNQCG